MVFLPLDRNEVLLDNWSAFLRDGVTLFGSDSDDLILIEGITSVGLLEVLFPDCPWDAWSSCGRSVGSEVGGCLHIQLSSLLVRTLSVSLSPTKEWVLAFLLLALLPLALPLGVRSASAV